MNVRGDHDLNLENGEGESNLSKGFVSAASNEIESANLKEKVVEKKSNKKKDGRENPRTAERNAWFEENKNEIYDFSAKTARWDMREIWQAGCKIFNCTPQVLYLAAMRYGQHDDRKWIPKENRTKYKKEQKTDSDAETEVIGEESNENSSKNGVWTCSLKDMPEFKQKDAKGLTHQLRMILWSVYRYPCNYNFNRQLSRNGEFIWTGFCKDCKCEFNIKTIDDKTGLAVAVKNFNSSINHSKNRVYTTGQFKSSLIEKLKTSSALVVQSKLSKGFKDNVDGD